MDMTEALTISAAGMQAQSMRLRVIAQNLANQDTTGLSPGTEAYRRKTITFAAPAAHGQSLGTVRVKRIGEDHGDQPLKYDPSHPAANAQGYVRMPNVNSFVEVMDMREAQRSYEANISVMQVSRGMISRTIELLK